MSHVTWVKQQKTLPPVDVVLGATVYVAGSSNGGRSWSAPDALATVGTGRALAGPNLVVRPQGDVLLTYPLIVPDDPADCVTDEDCAGRRDRVRRALRKPRRELVEARWWPALPPRTRARPRGRASAENFSLTLDRRGVAYLAAHDEGDAPRSQIIVRRSRDGGRSWRSLTNADKGSRAHGFRAQPTSPASHEDEGWGRIAHFKVPGAGEIGLYAPRHPSPLPEFADCESAEATYSR